MKKRQCSTGTCEELELLKAQVLTLEQRQQNRSDKALDRLEVQLRERSKELDALFKLTKLIEQNEHSFDNILKGTVALLPTSWQYPEITCARISYRKQVFQTSNFKSTQWRQKAPIIMYGLQEGVVEVHYLKKRPPQDEGPFLKEERQLINAVSSRIAKVLQRINAQRQLQIKQQALLDSNVELHDSLVQSLREKKIVGVSIQAKINKIITPIIYALQEDMSPNQLEYLELMKKSLGDIIAPFVDGNSDAVSKLSPVEIQVCNMIKYGLPTKQIARIRRSSPSTVNRHRESIRRKLGITNSKVNLTSYLNNIVLE